MCCIHPPKILREIGRNRAKPISCIGRSELRSSSCIGPFSLPFVKDIVCELARVKETLMAKTPKKYGAAVKAKPKSKKRKK